MMILCLEMKVEDFSDIRTGHGFRERLANDPRGAFCVIQPKNIRPDGLISFDNGSPLRMEASAPRILQPKEILFVSRGRFSAAVFEEMGSGPWIVPASVLVLSVKTDRVLPEYVACYFNSASGNALLQRHGEQTTVPFISAQTLGGIDIPVPALARQKALVALDRAASKQARLLNRKQELIRQILNRELTNGEQALKGNAP